MSTSLKLRGLTSSSGKQLVRQYTRVGIVIYPHEGDPVFGVRKTSPRILTWDKQTTEGTVTSFSFNKRMGQAAGQWTATVKLSPASSLSPMDGDVMDGDWVDVVVLRNGYLFGLLRGQLVSVREIKKTVGGATVRTLQLAGTDHGGPFERPIAWQNLWIQTLSELTQGLFTQRVGFKAGGTPSEMFETLVRATFQPVKESRSGSYWKMPPSLATVPGAGFMSALKIVNDSKTLGGYYNNVQLWTQAGQSLHQTLSQWCNPLLNEWWYDVSMEPQDVRSLGVAGYKASMMGPMLATIRERPFLSTVYGEYSPWYYLRTTEIPSWLVTESDIGFSGHDRFNLFEITCDLAFGNTNNQVALNAPSWNRDNVQTHGVRPYLEKTGYIAGDGKADFGSWMAERVVWQQLLTDWYGPNPYWLNGSKNVGVMLPDVKIGERVKFTTGSQETDETYYVEGVDLSYRFDRSGDHGRSVLHLSRGYLGPDEWAMRTVKKVSEQYKQVF